MVDVQYCDGGPLDQAIKNNSRFKRTMVRACPPLAAVLMLLSERLPGQHMLLNSVHRMPPSRMAAHPQLAKDRHGQACALADVSLRWR